MLMYGEFSALVECDEWIHLARTSRGKIARDQRHSQENKRCSCEPRRSIACSPDFCVGRVLSSRATNATLRRTSDAPAALSGSLHPPPYTALVKPPPILI